MLKKVGIIAAASVLALATLAGCGSQQAAQNTAQETKAKTITGAADLEGAKIAVQEGTTGDDYVTDEVKGAEVSRFKRVVDAGMDLKNGKVDAVVVDDQVAKDLVAEIDGLTILPENGTIDTIRKAYIDKDEAALAELAAKATPTGGEKLVMGTNAEFAPFEYMDDNNEIAGYDIEIAKEIARQSGMELSIENMNFDGLIAALSSGKVDMVIAGMTVDDERKQQVDFSENYYDAAQVIIVRK